MNRKLALLGKNDLEYKAAFDVSRDSLSEGKRKRRVPSEAAVEKSKFNFLLKRLTFTKVKIFGTKLAVLAKVYFINIFINFNVF